MTDEQLRYVTYLAVFATPLIPALATFLLLKRSTASVSGVLGRWTIQLGGPAAAFVALLILGQRNVLISNISDYSSIDIGGNFELRLTSDELSEPVTGSATVFQNGDGLHMSGVLSLADRVFPITSEVGTIANREVSLLLRVQDGTVAGIGVLVGVIPSNHPSDIALRFSLTELSWRISNEIGRSGTIEFHRTGVPPPVTLIIVELLPLVAVLLLYSIRRSAEANRASARSDVDRVVIDLGGPIAVYAVLLMLSASFFDRTVVADRFAPPEIASTDFSLDGSWTYENYQFWSGDDSDTEEVQHGRKEGEGVALIRQDGNRVSVNGELREPVQGSATMLPVPWHTAFGLVTESGGVYLYYKVQEGLGSSGLCTGRLLATSPSEFTCSFDDVESHSENAGVTVFRR